MIENELLNILACPITKRSLFSADKSSLERVIELQGQGILRSITGSVIEGPITGLLVNEDRSYAYIIRDGIPILLSDEALDFRGIF